MARSHPRSTHLDSHALWKRSRIQPRFHGLESIPPSGALVIAANHFQRRGLWIGWTAAAIDLGLQEVRSGDRLHWLVTGNLRLLQWRNAGPVIPGSEWIFSRVAETYGMSALPAAAERRAAALRGWLRHLKAGDTLGMFPEGTRGSAMGLVSPEPGISRILELVNRLDAPVLPVGVSEPDGEALQVAFGAPVRRLSATELMDRISDLTRDPEKSASRG